MGKFYGEIGYAQLVETTPGVWQEQMIKHNYHGDVLKNTLRLQEGKNLNTDIVVDNRLSIIADPFALENFSTMRYVKWMGTFWKITLVDVQKPRLILSIGGVYNTNDRRSK